MRKYGFGPTPTQVNALRDQKKLVEDKVSVLVDSIRKELKEEIQSDLRSVIEEMVRDIIRSQTKTSSLAQEPSMAPSVARRDIRIPTSSNLDGEGSTHPRNIDREGNLVPEFSNIPSANREDAHVELHAASNSSSIPRMTAQAQETQAGFQQSSANKDKSKKKRPSRNVRSVWKR